VLTVAVIFLFVRALYDPVTAWGAAFFYAAAPLSLYYTRTFMPESMLMFFFMAALWGFYRWVEKPSWAVWMLSLACASLAVLVKPTALLAFFPMLGMLWDRRGLSGIRDYRVWLFFPAVLAASVLWYSHAYKLFQETGLTFGILSAGYNKFQTLTMWREIGGIGIAHFRRLFDIVLTPLGGALFLFGLALSGLKPEAFPRRGFLYAWLAGFAVYLVVVMEGNRLLEYYQIFIVPVAGIVAARGLVFLAQSLFPSGGRAAWILMAGAAGVFLILSSLIAGERYAPVKYAQRAYQFARKAADYSKPGELFLVIDNNLNYNSYLYGKMNCRMSPPHQLYYLNRPGWVFYPHEVAGTGPENMLKFIDRGARYLVLPAPLLEQLPGWKAWLAKNQTQLLDDTENGLMLYRLEPTGRRE